MPTPVRAYAPASIGNFAAGFDILGAAICAEDGDTLLGDIVDIESADQDEFHAVGAWAHALPTDPADNLVVRARNRVAHVLGDQGGSLAPCRITLHKHLPLASGLGSSAASIVAALVALDAWSGSTLGIPTLYTLAGELEGVFSGGVHHDNTGPSLLGGLLAIGADGPPQRLPFPSDLRLCVAHPDLELPTAKARAVLPTTVPRADAVAFAQNLALLVHALHTDDRSLMRRTLRDPLAEPFRAPLVPGFAEAKAAAVTAGALGCSLSGSGPSVFAVADVDRAPGVVAGLVAGFRERGIGARSWVCTLDSGARLL